MWTARNVEIPSVRWATDGRPGKIVRMAGRLTSAALTAACFCVDRPSRRGRATGSGWGQSGAELLQARFEGQAWGGARAQRVYRPPAVGTQHVHGKNSNPGPRVGCLACERHRTLEEEPPDLGNYSCALVTDGRAARLPAGQGGD